MPALFASLPHEAAAFNTSNTVLVPEVPPVHSITPVPSPNCSMPCCFQQLIGPLSSRLRAMPGTASSPDFVPSALHDISIQYKPMIGRVRSVVTEGPVSTEAADGDQWTRVWRPPLCCFESP